LEAILKNYQNVLGCNSSAPLRLIIIVLFITACEPAEPFRTELALGTVCTVTLYEQGKNSVYEAVFSRIREIENMMSVNIPSSDISRINNNAGIAPVRVNEETFKVIERALYFAQLSDGAFDPAVGPLVNLWDIGSAQPRVPSQDEIDQALPLVNWRNVELDADNLSVFLTQRGMALDLGAIAKGYAADAALITAKNAGVSRALIDLGGNIVILGTKRDRSPWRVGIQKPDIIRGEIIGFIQFIQSASLFNLPKSAAGDKITVVTSGIYERYFTKDGTHYHHIFNSLLNEGRGYPVQNGLVSVSIIAENSMDADALSTAVFVLGYEKGKALLESFPEAGAVFIFEDNSVAAAPGVDFILTDRTFLEIPF